MHAASHDLLAPLSNIEGSIGVINKIKVEDPNLNKFLTIINASVKKFSGLIKDIATIGKIESDMIAMEMIDMDEIIGNIKWSLENKIQQSGAIIKMDLQVKHMFFSKKNLRSIVYNLVSNAIKFKSDAVPVIHIYNTQVKDNIVLTVEDNGIGIPKEKLDKIFEMYGRLHPDIEGQGIGLYLAKKLVNAAGGTIVVESKPGRGSKFMIYLKAEQEHPITAASLV